MSDSTQIIIIHGSYGSPNENWFPWLSSELAAAGYEVAVPAFPTPDGQSLTNWRRVFDKEIGELTPNMVLVGHSLGPSFILNLLNKSSQPVRGIVLAAGFLGRLGLPEFDTINETFVCGEFDWHCIRRNAGTVKVYNSDNDPYVPIHKGRDLAAHLGVELDVLHEAGHINKEAGFEMFPRLLEDIQRLFPVDGRPSSNSV